MQARSARPLEAVYATIFIGAIMSRRVGEPGWPKRD
jgi:hypothetical protein